MVVATGDVRLPRLRRRDAGAEVERLYRRYSGEVLRYALLVLRSRSDAEDVTQAVFMRALRALERGEKVRTPRNWLIKIAHNEARRLLVSRKLHVELPEQLAAEPEEHGRAQELKDALAALPAAQRQALVLRELEGRTYAEIAASLALSVSAVETLIFRARRSVREQLECAVSCEEFPALLDDPDARARVRAHARVCADCATLERRARGRKGALKRIASSLGLPWWGGKLAAVALTTATVAGVATAVPKHHHPTLIPRSGTRVEPFRLTPAQVAKPVVHRVAVPPRKPAGTKKAPAASPAPPEAKERAARPHLTVLPGPEPPEPTPEPSAPQPPPVPPPTKAVPAPQPSVTITPPAVTLPPAPAVPAIPVAVPDPPSVVLPAVTVPVPAVTVPVPPPPPLPVTLPAAPPIVNAP